MAGRQTNRSEYSRRYRQTPKGAAACAWNRLTSRAGAKYNHRPCYGPVEVLLAREQFMAWAIPQYEAWFREHAGVTPSVDRIDSSGHYQLGNLRLITRSENCRRTRANRMLNAPTGHCWCSKCKRYLPVAMFTPARITSKSRTGYKSRCKPCRVLEVASYRRRRKRQQAE